MLEIALVCDHCKADISRGIAGNEVRRASAAMYERRAGKDLCLQCAGRAGSSHAQIVNPADDDAARPPRELADVVGVRASAEKKAGDSPRPRLILVCPTTKERFASGISTNIEDLRAIWKTTREISCPHCGDVHRFSVREAYLNSALSDASERI